MNLRDKKILIVGLGQIGGSYAQALKEKHFDVGAIDTRPSAIEYALNRNWISHGRSDIDPDYISEFDIIIFALYPHTFLEWIKENQSYIKPEALITDVTGVKVSVIYDVQKMLRPDLEFIGAHPMAGRETSGVENSDKSVFNGANYIVTPTDKNTSAAIEICKELGKTLGFNHISILSPEDHDKMIGFLSQLTHCIAVSLMLCSDSEELADYCGDSFRDLTRIAKINDVMWSELFVLNKNILIKEMDLFSDKFLKLRESIANSDIDTIRKYLQISTEHRKWFDKERKKNEFRN